MSVPIVTGSLSDVLPYMAIGHGAAAIRCCSCIVTGVRVRVASAIVG